MSRASTPSFVRLTTPAPQRPDSAHHTAHAREAAEDEDKFSVGMGRNYTEPEARAHRIPEERRFVIPKDQLEPRTVRGFESPLQADRGKIVSKKGTFAGRHGTKTEATKALLLERRRALLRRRGLPESELPPMPAGGPGASGCEEAFYLYPDAVKDQFTHSHGVTRTAPRWRSNASVAAESPGPIFYPNPNPRSTVGAPFSRAKRFPYDEALVQELKVRRARTPEREVAGRLAMLQQASLGDRPGDGSAAKPDAAPRCTFGHRLPRHDEFSANECPKHTYDCEETNAHFVASVVMRQRRRAPKGAVEVTPGPGHFHRAGYHTTAPCSTMGRRLRHAPDPSPGPAAYDVMAADARLRRHRT